MIDCKMDDKLGLNARALSNSNSLLGYTFRLLVVLRAYGGDQGYSSVVRSLKLSNVDLG